MAREVEIVRLGAQGDGVAEGPDGPVFVPFALPGERVAIGASADGKHAELLEVLVPSPERIELSARILACAVAAPSSIWRRGLISNGNGSRWCRP